MTNETENDFTVDPELMKLILDAVDRTKLLEQIGPIADKWIEENLAVLIRRYAQDAIQYLAKALETPSEEEVLDDRARMFIWVIANRVNEAVKFPVPEGRFLSWTFSLISLGYILRMHHEDESRKSATGTGSMPSPEST